MKNEHPILFSTQMVKAILEGRKTQTRRIVKPSNEQKLFLSLDLLLKSKFDYIIDNYAQFIHPLGGPLTVFKCPYGKVGDKLWVKESFYAFGKWSRRFNEKKKRDEWFFIDKTIGSGVEYKFEDDPPTDWQQAKNIISFEERRKSMAYHKRPSIYMPRKACRIELKIVNIRVERLHDITEEDCKNEGIDCQNLEGEDHFLMYSPKDKRKGIFCGPCRVDGTYVSKTSAFFSDKPAWHSYRSLWQSINSEKSWKDNPWVWVIEFEKYTKTDN
jgi:hypothetical protein